MLNVLALGLQLSELALALLRSKETRRRKSRLFSWRDCNLIGFRETRCALQSGLSIIDCGVCRRAGNRSVRTIRDPRAVCIRDYPLRKIRVTAVQHNRDGLPARICRR